MIGKKQSARENSRTLSGANAERIELLRQQIMLLKQERHRLNTQPVSEEEANTRLDNWCARFAEWCGEKIDVERFAQNHFREPSFHDANELIRLAGIEAMRAMLSGKLSVYYQTHTGIAVDDRTEERESLDARIYDLGREEEVLIREAEVAGLNILRRDDADPAVVLLPDAALAQNR